MPEIILQITAILGYGSLLLIVFPLGILTLWGSWMKEKELMQKERERKARR